MKTSIFTNDNIQDTIVCFHIGRGGHYYNQGHLSYVGERNINEFTYDLFQYYENQMEVYEQIKHLPNLLAKYYECCDNNNFDLFIKKGFDMGDFVWADCNGCSTGLLVDNDGTGRIDEDGEYNTTYCLRLSQISEKEAMCMIHSGDCTEDIVEFINENILG